MSQLKIGTSGNLVPSVPNTVNTMNGASKKVRRKPPTGVSCDIHTLFNVPCLTDQEYIQMMSPDERAWAQSLLDTTDEEIIKLRETDQKAPDWYIGRKKRMTGSKGPAAVGHNPYTTLFESIEEWVTGKSKRDNPYSLKIMQNGSDMEPIARTEYEVQMNQALTSKLSTDWKEFCKRQEQDASLKFQFVFRGVTIPIRFNSDQQPISPILRVIEKGLLIDKDRRWRGVSLDGIVMIDDIYAWVIEIKCPQKNEGAFYTLTPLYYYDQIENNIWTCMYHYDLKIPMCDFFIFSDQGWSLEPYALDRDYMTKWFLPRESRCFFKGYLPRQAEHIRQLNAASVLPDDIARRT
jgi:hypothetical protein